VKQHCYTAVSFICCELISSSGYYLAHRFDVHCLDSRGVNEGIHNSWPIYTLVITDWSRDRGNDCSTLPYLVMVV